MYKIYIAIQAEFVFWNEFEITYPLNKMKHKNKNNTLSEHAQYPIDKTKQKQKSINTLFW